MRIVSGYLWKGNTSQRDKNAMIQKTVIIDGDKFSDLESFYDEIDRVLTKDLNFKTGHNLNAFNDILCGDFGVFSYNENLKLIWTSFLKSKSLLGEELITQLIEIIKNHKHIKLEIID